MCRLQSTLVAIWLLLGLAMVVVAQPAPTVGIRADPTLGNILTDASGTTLYQFTRDGPGVSNCYDQCARTWPPLLLGDGEPVAPPELGGTLGGLVRRDGSQQVTYNDMPLYTYARDTNPGETNGQGVGGVWFVVEAVLAEPTGDRGVPAPTERPQETPRAPSY